jgi:hypothetical protein
LIEAGGLRNPLPDSDVEIGAMEFEIMNICIEWGRPIVCQAARHIEGSALHVIQNA